MRTPNQESGDNTDKLMLMSMWTNTLRQEGLSKPLIAAGMGKPTYPVNVNTVKQFLDYWQAVLSRMEAIDYADPRGDGDAKKMMAKAMSRWYETEIKPEEILFTLGGAGALRIIFETFNMLNHTLPRYRVLTPFPHYTLYSDNRHQLHPIEVFHETGYRLTARALQTSIEQAYELAQKDNNTPQFILLSNPSNPLGTVISEQEWLSIIPVLRQYPELTVVIDEAYAEMCWSAKKTSLLKLAPDLKKRLILMRSATKAHSAAGERMAMLMAFDKNIMTHLTNKNISTLGHPPISAQIAYAYTMEKFGKEEADALQHFYKPKVDYVQQCLQEMKISLPDRKYRIDGTFYVMADLSELFGMPIPHEAKRALEKLGKVTTSEELAYSLLFQEALMVAPGEYFGLPKDKGYVRITCSGSQQELEEMMLRIETMLLKTRKLKFATYIEQMIIRLKQLKPYDPLNHKIYLNKLLDLLIRPTTCSELADRNQQLKIILSELNVITNRELPEGRRQAAQVIQSFLKTAVNYKKTLKKEETLEAEWHSFVDEKVENGRMKNFLLNLTKEERRDFKEWRIYLEQKTGQENPQP